MANEHYENANTQAEEQHEQQTDTSKARDMLEALDYSMNAARHTLTKALVELRKQHPDMDIGTVYRRFHLSLLECIKSKPLESFKIVFGLLGLATFDSLTDEDKEALRNDLLDNN